jgi:flavin reductase (DIM6/NTAB) family NADH-FMN oxidoreductase RutF
MAIDPALQRRIMGRYTTGVTLVTTRYGEGDRIWGMTANSFTSLSLDPPLVLLTVDRRNSMYEYILQGHCFAVNILTTHQEAISHRFAMRGPKDFADIPLTVAETGAPILVGALGYLDCRLIQNIAAGDHDIFIGEIVTGAIQDGQPLLFYDGKYTRLALSGTGVFATGSERLEEVYGYYGSF